MIYQVVYIDRDDGVTVYECGVRADSIAEARQKFLAGQREFPRPIGDRSNEGPPFYDVSAEEYILSLEESMHQF